LKHSISNPFPWYKKMSTESPVVFDKDFLHFFGSKGAWHVFRYDDVQKVINDYETFSNEIIPKIPENPLSSGITVSDPPRHKQLRMLVSKAFTPRAIDNMKPWIEEITHKLLDQVVDQGEMDVASDLATPVPIQVIAKMLGVPYADQDKFKAWSTMILKQPSEIEGGIDTFVQSQQEMAQYFMKMFELRQEQPEDDLISRLLQAEVDGEKLSPQDLLAFCITLLVAGNETTTNLINNSILTFTEYPEVQEHLLQHPEDIPKAIEESLRYRSPAQYVIRVATRDVQFGGHLIKKGDFINLWLGSANRDESVFANPDQFDLHRTNLKHIAFGHGIHYCLGAPLARLEAGIVLRLLFERMHQFQLKTNTPLAMNQSDLLYSIIELPVIFSKR
jgi:cytochrome P450